MFIAALFATKGPVHKILENLDLQRWQDPRRSVGK